MPKLTGRDGLENIIRVCVLQLVNHIQKYFKHYIRFFIFHDNQHYFTDLLYKLFYDALYYKHQLCLLYNQITDHGTVKFTFSEKSCLYPVFDNKCN